MKPATKSLSMGLALIIIVTALAGAGIIAYTTQIARTQAMEQLKRASLVESQLQARQLEALQLRAQILAGDTAFVDYVAQSLMPSPQTGGAVDSASISDLLNDRRNGYDVAMVLDNQGKVISTSGNFSRDRAGIQHDPLVTQAIQQLKPVQGIWLDDGKLMWVVSSPLLRANTLQGVLIAATRISHNFPVTISEISGSDVELLTDPSTGVPLASNGIDIRLSDLLTNNSAGALNTPDDTPHFVPLHGEAQAITAWVAPLQVSNGRAALVAVNESDGAQQPLRAALIPMLAGLVLLALIATIAVLIQWWRTWKPLQDMLEVIERAGSGDAFLMVRVQGSPIVRELRERINRLIHQRHR